MNPNFQGTGTSARVGLGPIWSQWRSRHWLPAGGQLDSRWTSSILPLVKLWKVEVEGLSLGTDVSCWWANDHSVQQCYSSTYFISFIVCSPGSCFGSIAQSSAYFRGPYMPQAVTDTHVQDCVSILDSVYLPSRVWGRLHDTEHVSLCSEYPTYLAHHCRYRQYIRAPAKVNGRGSRGK